MSSIGADKLDFSWPNELIIYLTHIVREHKFNWPLISDSVSHFAANLSTSNTIDITTITPEMCRRQFAASYDYEHINTAIESNIDKEKEEIYKVNMDDLSLEQLIEHVDKKEKYIEKRKEEVFKRVLDSLGGSDVTSEKDISNDVAISAFKESLRVKESKSLQREQLLHAQEEKKQLEKERQKLKNRFEPGSIDQEGDNPLDHIFETNASSSVSNHSLEINVDLQLNNDFDAILSELERELEARAPDKEGMHDHFESIQ